MYPFGAFHREFDKNANSIDVKAEMFFVLFSLATIGVCVFCAVTSVAALFIFRREHYEKAMVGSCSTCDYYHVDCL